MGLFDTICFPSTIPCASCGAPVAATQTKQLGCSLVTYRIGDMVAECPVITGVLEERLSCERCPRSDQRIYVTLWHSLLTGVYRDRSEAEGRLMAVDRADILNHLIAHQGEEQRLRRLLSAFLGTVSAYAEYLEAADKEKYLSEPLNSLLRLELRDHLSAADPLSSIVEHYRREMGAAGEDAGIF
jgi:hypothetical protein